MLFLTLECFSQTGGVQMVCRSLGKALAAVSEAQHKTFKMYALCDQTIDLDSRYLEANAFSGFGYNRLKFCAKSILQAPFVTCLILAHINLLPIAYIIKFISPCTRIILIAHGKEVLSTMSKWKSRFLNNKVEIWAVSEFTKKILIERQAISESKVEVLNNCLDPFFVVPPEFNKPAYLRARYKIEADDLVLLTISRLTGYEKDKGYDLVLECMSDLIKDFPNIRYLIAGNASKPEHKRLLNRIKELQLNLHVTLTGFVAPKEMTDHHLLADIFILPSSKEGFGLVFLEALVCGSKVIGGNKDGSVDALLNGRLGTLIDPDSKTEIMAALKHLLKQGADRAAAQQRQRLTIENFSFGSYKSKIAALINQKY